MERDMKVWDTAALLLERYGQKAPEVAQGWSRELTERHEPEAAARCLEIVDAASKMLTEREPLSTKAKRRRRRPSGVAAERREQDRKLLRPKRNQRDH
jgi:hypothetical protein